MHVLTGRRRRLGAAVALILMVALLVGLVPGRSGADGEERFGRRRQMLALTNHDRERRARLELQFAERLSRYAKDHSEAMARRGTIFHSEEDRLRAVLEAYDWSIAGENVGVGESLESLESAFMASKLHRQNILRPTFQHAAVGVARSRDRVWVTVIFYG